MLRSDWYPPNTNWSKMEWFSNMCCPNAGLTDPLKRSVLWLFNLYCLISLTYCTFPFLPVRTLTSSLSLSLHHIRLIHRPRHSCPPPSLLIPPPLPSPSSSSSSFSSPSHCLIYQGYIIFVLLLLLEPTPAPPPPSRSLSANPLSLLGEVWRRSSESWDYPTHLPGDEHIQSVCACCLCVTNGRPAWVSVHVLARLWIIERTLWLLERSSEVLNLPSFHKSSCDCCDGRLFSARLFSC